LSSRRPDADWGCVDKADYVLTSSLYIGFESVNRHCLDEVHKGWNKVENYVRNVRRLHDRDIMVNGSFVFGFDNDSTDVFDDTVRFGIEARLETATFTILTPYPETLLYKKLAADGRILDHDWAHYDTTRPVYRPRLMSAEELEAGYFRAYREFYSWPSIWTRCRVREPGFAKRLLLNVAYKRVEPLYHLLGKGLKAGWGRPVMNWFARPNTRRWPAPKGAEAIGPALTTNGVRGRCPEAVPANTGTPGPLR
jgi:radical SAM superfamily enzyme YgiQ (UPF0313 family)